MSQEIEVFLQGEGIKEITLVRVSEGAKVRELIGAAREHGFPITADDAVIVVAEDAEEPLDLDMDLRAAGIGHRSHVHAHRCRRIDVTVNFGSEMKQREFAPSATIARVLRWATGKRGFDLAEGDAADHLLKLCDSTDRPGLDTHIGSLVAFPKCELCFDLVPKQRVEG